MDTEKNDKYKYSVLEQLKKLSAIDYEISRKRLPRALGVSNSTFKRWLGIRLGESAEIPIKHLSTLAKFFKVTIDDLINEEPPTINLDQIKEVESKEDKQYLNLD